MKKVFLLIGLIILATIILVLLPGELDAIWFGYLPAIFIIFLLPFISGMLLILFQTEDRSYRFVPKLLFGSVLVSVMMPIIIQLTHFIRQGYIDRIFSSFMYHNLLDLFLPFLVLSIFGGLMGLVIRGTSLLISQHKIYEKV